MSTEAPPIPPAAPESRTPPGRRVLPWLPIVALAAAVLAIPILLAAWGSQACACKPPPPTPDASSPVDGVIVSVDSSGLTDVRGFVLRTSGGFAFDFVLGKLENATAFPPGHLMEHMATSDPVRVYFRIEEGSRVVYRVDDAPS